MRLSPKEIAQIKKEIQALDPQAEVFLYGSRLNDNNRGGDIDLLILSEKLNFSDKVSLLVNLKICLGDQKIDLLIKPPGQVYTDAFIKSILPQAQRL